ncbi:hypothetical protein ABKN59_003728 [Abortiporus biennis]
MGSPESLPTAGEHLMAAKMFSLASCVMLFYDIVLTFGDEVERIWKQRFTGATILWFLNRYLSPLGYIVIIVSFHSRWPVSVCNRYVLYPEILKIFTAFTIGVIFILRLYAIYSRNRIILITFTILLFAELAVKIYAFTDGVRLDLPPEFDGCILTGRDADGKRIVYTWVAELIFDTSVFFATLYRTVSLYRSSELGPSSNLIRVIMRDGVVYFGVIFVSNLVTVLIFVAAPPDLKVVNASFSTLVTSLMVSRLMLNLRREAMRRSPAMDNNLLTNSSLGHRRSQSGFRSFGSGSDFTSANKGFDSFATASDIWSRGTIDMQQTASTTGMISKHETVEDTSGLASFGITREMEDNIIGNLGAELEGWSDDSDDQNHPDERRGYRTNDMELGNVRSSPYTQSATLHVPKSSRTKARPLPKPRSIPTISVQVTEEVIQTVEQGVDGFAPKSRRHRKLKRQQENRISRGDDQAESVVTTVPRTSDSSSEATS